ncbi:zinc finger protein ZFP2-like isoform X2 [Episyrphus balteatus]|uniref:zinc finger protein ZFP2-like isoform X2 n=1 Tax=Episyrphus balteatus TaxID=286459 RepID=UPI0024860A60|nr:zinc finger protein ZFP2-like isoform X2 [Episyrphus balteatus]
MVAICRLCASLKKSETLTFIRDKNHDLCTKLLKCCQFEMDLNDGLPRGVCPECVRNLNVSFEFYVRVHDSQQSLEKLLNIQQKVHVSENITAPEQEKLLEERKSYDLIASTAASLKNQSIIGKDIPQLDSNDIDPLTNSEFSKNGDGNDDNGVKAQNDSRTPICLENIDTENEEKEETYEFLISDEDVIQDTKIEELMIASDCDVETKSDYGAEDFNFDNEEIEIIEVEGNNESKQEQDKANQMNISTWSNYPWKCVYCAQVFFTAQELVEHYDKVELKVALWTCVDCLKDFPRYYSLINHVRQRHRQQLMLLCDLCNVSFDSFRELNNHRQSKHNNVNFKMLLCSKCGKGFNNTNSLHIHSKCHLPGEMRLVYGCNLCDKKFTSSSNLKFHQKMHAGMKDFVCDQCGKKFIQRSNLEEHLVSHVELTPYECDLCKKRFKTCERLSKHKTRHTDDKPFKCNLDGCDKTFRTKDAMNSHGRIHTGEMPFECEFCQKPFRFRSTLLTHHNTHTGVRPYSCDDCNHQFTNWPNYNKHMKRRHGLDLSSSNPRGKKPSVVKKTINKKTRNPTNSTNNHDDESLHQEVCYENYVEEGNEHESELKEFELEHFDVEFQ